MEDSEIVKKVIDGRDDLFSLLVKKYKNYAFTLALRVVKNREDAEEIAHDSFIKAYKSLKKFKRESKFSTWFFRIVINTAISASRKRKYDHIDISEAYDVGSEENNCDNLIVKNERIKVVNEAMNQLKPDDAVLLNLYYFRSFDLREINAITGIDINNLKIKLFRARKRMGQIISRNLNDEVNSLI
ncbi:MAG TPA: RNA polymerase sigma factor [Cyclobacteriaceae bacterium]